MNDALDEMSNPMQLDGFDFLEFAGPDSDKLVHQFKMFGFQPLLKHKDKAITVYGSGELRYVVNAEKNAPSSVFCKKHGAGASAMAFRVADADFAFKEAVAKGATPYEGERYYADAPAIYGIGDTLIYFIDRYGDQTIFDRDFVSLPEDPAVKPTGLYYLDHLTHNVDIGRMDVWAYDFYKKIFNFRQIRFFDIKGQKTGLISRALRSPCNKITIPLNEATDEQSQIQEFITAFNGEGIQHIAMGCKDIFKTVKGLVENGIKFMPPPPDTYYDEMLDERLPGHGISIEKLRELSILMDGSTQGSEPKLLLQIFTENMMGPVFFEIIERRGDEGFGEGNFTALFESIERDQMRRGVL